MPFVPHFLLRDMVGWYLALGLLAALGGDFPVGIGREGRTFRISSRGDQARVVFPVHVSNAESCSPHTLDRLEGEVVGVLFFGFCGLVVLCVPFVDRGPRVAGYSTCLAFVSVVFFIVMTSWGWFSTPDVFALRVSLGAFLTALVAVLMVPFAAPGTPLRRALYALIGCSLVVCLVALGWDKFR